MEFISTLEAFVSTAWQLMYNAAEAKYDELKNPVIGTLNKEDCELRIIVLRAVHIEKRLLTFYTDVRSPKVVQLKSTSHLSWLFYSAQLRFQIRAKGKPALHHNDELSAAHWNKIPIMGRMNYASSISPGTITKEYTDGLPINWNENIPLKETEFAYQNFLLVQCEMDELELLHLHKDGHQRALFNWEKNKWDGHWLIP